MGTADQIASFRSRAVQDCGQDAVLHMHKFWNETCGGLWAPAWRDVNLLQVTAPLLPYLLVCDITKDGDYKYRYWGRAHSEHHGIDYTGRTLSDFEDRWSVLCLRDQYEQVIAARAPLLFEMTYKHSSDVIFAYRAPLSDDGETVTGVISMVERRHMPGLPPG